MPRIKSVSADEARTKYNEVSVRRGFGSAGDAETVTKAAKSPASWNKDQRSARFIMTTEQVDRYGDIVATKGGDLTEFMRNPVGLLFHNSRTWPVAKWANVETKLAGRPPRMEGDFVMLPEGGPVKEIDECAWMIANDGIRACSIGFIPDWDHVDMLLDDEQDWITGWKFNAWELTECSVCAVPANAGALVKSAHGDTNLALELLEDVLDNWVKTPAGLILSRSDFETARTAIKDGVSAANIERKKLGLEPIVEDAGGKLMSRGFSLDKTTGEFTKMAKAEDAVSTADATTTTEPEVVADAAPAAEENKTAEEVEAAAWISDDVKALVAEVKGSPITVEKGLSFVGEADGQPTFTRSSGGMLSAEVNGTTKFVNIDTVPADATEQLAELAKSAAPASTTIAGDVITANAVVMKLDVDTTVFEAAVEKADGLLSKLFKKYAKFLGAPEEEVARDVEPTIVPPAPPPTAEEIATVKARALATRERLAAKGLVDSTAA